MNERSLILIVVVAAVLAALWYFRDELMPQGEEPAPVAIETPVVEPAEDPGPAHPLEPVEPDATIERELEPLPDLDDSDAYFLLALVDLFGSELEPLLVNEALIDKIVATIDNLPRKHVSEKIRPLGRLADEFSVEASEIDGEYVLSADNFSRYDLIAGLISSADLDQAVDTYRRFYPLFQESYVRLGYPDAYFNDRVVEVIDHLLETPTPDGPIVLLRPHVLYEFADPELAELSAGQKLLLRMGSAHSDSIKTVLRNLRTRIE